MQRLQSCLACLCRLIFAGKQMSDDKSAKDFNIEGGSVLHLVGATLIHLLPPHFSKAAALL